MTTAILEVPHWLIILRGIQLFLSLIVLALSAYGVYWIAFNSLGFAIFVALATLIITLYNILTTRVGSLAKLYNHWAVLALDIFGVIFWLSTMGALAALRAAFFIPTTINGCGHTGDIGGGYCYKHKRGLEKRQVFVATHGYLNTISVSAGFSAINFILFVVTLVFTSIAIHRTRKGSTATTTGHDESKLESHGMEAVQGQQAPPPPASYGQSDPNYHDMQHQHESGPPPPANYRA